jgi:hypothetical protein
MLLIHLNLPKGGNVSHIFSIKNTFLAAKGSFSMNIHIKKEAIRKGSLYLYSLEVFKKYSDAKL